MGWQFRAGNATGPRAPPWTRGRPWRRAGVRAARGHIQHDQAQLLGLLLGVSSGTKLLSPPFSQPAARGGENRAILEEKERLK